MDILKSAILGGAILLTAGGIYVIDKGCNTVPVTNANYSVSDIQITDQHFSEDITRLYRNELKEYIKSLDNLDYAPPVHADRPAMIKIAPEPEPRFFPGLSFRQGVNQIRELARTHETEDLFFYRERKNENGEWEGMWIGYGTEACGPSVYTNDGITCPISGGVTSAWRVLDELLKEGDKFTFIHTHPTDSESGRASVEIGVFTDFADWEDFAGYGEQKDYMESNGCTVRGAMVIAECVICSYDLMNGTEKSKGASKIRHETFDLWRKFCDDRSNYERPLSKSKNILKNEFATENYRMDSYIDDDAVEQLYPQMKPYLHR